MKHTPHEVSKLADVEAITLARLMGAKTHRWLDQRDGSDKAWSCWDNSDPVDGGRTWFESARPTEGDAARAWLLYRIERGNLHG